MMKIGFAVAAAAAVLMTAPSLVSTTPAKAQTLEMAQGVEFRSGGTAAAVAVAGVGLCWQTNERQRNAKPPVVKFAGIKTE